MAVCFYFVARFEAKTELYFIGLFLVAVQLTSRLAKEVPARKPLENVVEKDQVLPRCSYLSIYNAG